MTERSDQRQLIRRTGGNVMSVASSQLLGKFATLAWLLVATRVLDQAAFGAFSFALALALLVGSLVEWGFTPTMVRLASREPHRLNAAYTSAQVWQFGLGLPAYAVAIAVAHHTLHTSSAVWVMTAAVVATAAETWCSTARSAASVLQRQGRVSLALAAQRLLIAGCAVTALLAIGDVVALAVAFLVGTAIGVPIHSLALRRAGIRLNVAGLRSDSLRPLWTASHYVGLSGVVLMGLAKLDQVFLGILSTDESVGAYAAAYRLLETVFFVSFALRAALFPVLAANPRAGVVRAGLRGAWTVLCFVYIPYAVVCLMAPQAVLHLFFGSPYDQSAALSLQWLSVVPLLFAGAYIFSAALLAMEKQRPILYAALVALAVNVVGDLILIPSYGPAGAAAATVAGYGAQMLLTGLALVRLGGLPPLLPGVLLTSGAGLALAALMATVPTFIALLVGLPLYVVCWLLLTRAFVPSTFVEVMAVLPAWLRRRLAPLIGTSAQPHHAKKANSV